MHFQLIEPKRSKRLRSSETRPRSVGILVANQLRFMDLETEKDGKDERPVHNIRTALGPNGACLLIGSRFQHQESHSRKNIVQRTFPLFAELGSEYLSCITVGSRWHMYFYVMVPIKSQSRNCIMRRRRDSIFHEESRGVL
jgi:hypothetical protein